MRLAARATRLALAAFALLMIGPSMAVASPIAATKSVNIQNFAYNPTPITINVGDGITWTNSDQAAHSAKAQSGSFDTGILAAGQSKTLVFNAAGTFAYICGVHGASMSGTVIVQAAATPAPTPPPTAPPTAPPTVVRTPAPTVAPTIAPTVAPTPVPTTAAPAASPTAAPTTAAPTSSPAPATTAPVAVASPTPSPAAAPASDNTPLLIGGAVVVVAAVGAVAFVLLRR